LWYKLKSSRHPRITHQPGGTYGGGGGGGESGSLREGLFQERFRKSIYGVTRPFSLSAVVPDGRLVAKPFVTPAAIVVTENYIVMLIYGEHSGSPGPFVGSCQVPNVNAFVMPSRDPRFSPRVVDFV